MMVQQEDVFGIIIPKEKILFADFTNRKALELIVLCESGNIYCYIIENKKFRLLYANYPVQSNAFKLYSFKNYICLVENRQTKGIVLNLEIPGFKLELSRGEYQVEHCSFPIAFYSAENKDFLIHGTDWNRLDITCLDNLQIKTDRLVDYDSKTNYFDYFHSLLSVSPDGTHFSSNGWIWSPVDVITIYSVENFLKEYELSQHSLYFGQTSGYFWDRPLCWIDNNMIAIAYNQAEDEELKADYITQILLIDIEQDEIVKRLECPVFKPNEYGEAMGSLYFDNNQNRIIAIGQQSGLYIQTLDGKLIYSDLDFKPLHFSVIHSFFYKLDDEKSEMIIQRI
jgi:hypothetical protein